MLRVERLCVNRAGKPIVTDLDMELEAGVITGLLGPNGAGKTTTIAALLGLIPSTAQRLELDGNDWRTETTLRRQNMGYVPQHVALYEGLSVQQNLEVWSGLYGLSGRSRDRAIDRSLELANLRDRSRERVKHLSGGMKRRLNLAIGLLNDPAIVICDEPTTGVDAQSRRAIYEALFQLRDAGKHLLYTTHYFQEVEDLCTEVVVLHNGRKVTSGPLELLLETPTGGESPVFTVQTEHSLEDLQRACASLGIPETAVSVKKQSMEALYDALISRSDEEGK